MITSLDDLINNLKKTNPKEYPKLIKQIDIPCSDFDKYVTWNKEAYTRNCIFRNENFELLLLCWGKNQTTPIHDHGGEQCWVYQIKGDIEEIRYDENNEGDLEATNKKTLTPGKITYMDDSLGFHALENNNDDKALTLHIYMNPIDECEVYDSVSESFESKELIYDSFISK